MQIGPSNNSFSFNRDILLASARGSRVPLPLPPCLLVSFFSNLIWFISDPGIYLNTSFENICGAVVGLEKGPIHTWVTK